MGIILQNFLSNYMQSVPRISVLLSVYNTEFYLVKRAIDSVMQQDYQDFELIFIDDGSEEEYRLAYAAYVAMFSQKMIYLQHTNCGQSESINRGIAKSKGEFITILDADDEFKPNHLSSCLAEMKFADLIASKTETVVDEEADYYVPDMHDNSKVIHVDDCILFATLFGKRQVFSSYRFNSTYAADARFYAEAAQEYIVQKVDLRTYVYYRNIPNSICATIKRNGMANLSHAQLS